MEATYLEEPICVMTELTKEHIKTKSKCGVTTLMVGLRGMNGTKRVLMGLVLALAVVFLHHDASGEARVLSVIFKIDMVNGGVDPDAGGKISGTLNDRSMTHSRK